MAAHWAFIATDLALIGTYAPMKKNYTKVRDKINEDLRKQIIPNAVDATAYYWNAEWEFYFPPGQDVSHGNNVVSYIVESHDNDSKGGWKDGDITGLINLLMKVVWNGKVEPDKMKFADYFNGTYGPGTGSLQGEGFVKLGRYNKDVQYIYQEYPDSGMFNRDKLVGARSQTQYFGNGALNAKILLS
jgi:hypothetical protein